MMIPSTATTSTSTVLPLSSTTATNINDDDEDVTAAIVLPVASSSSSCGGGTGGGTPKRRKRTVITTASTTTARTMMVHPPLRVFSFGRRGRALLNRFRRRRCRREFSYGSCSTSSAPSATVLVTVVSLIACNIAMVYLLYQTLHGRYSYHHGGRRFLQQRQQEQQQWHPSTKRPVIAGGVKNQPILPDNPSYRVPESMNIVGDRSDAYVLLRKEMDAILPPGDRHRSMRALQQIRQQHRPQQRREQQREREEHPYETFLSTPAAKEEEQVHQLVKATAAEAAAEADAERDGPRDVTTASDAAVKQRPHEPYDIYNCPDEPPAGYPYVWNLMRILEHWPADDVTPRSRIHQGLCVFDFNEDRHKAVAYRAAEVPFVVENDPAVAATAERWNYPGYLDKLLHDSTRHRAEYSENNHFMYYSAPSAAARAGRDARHQVPSDWKEPTKQIRMSYSEWIQRANITTTNSNAKNNEDRSSGPNEPHWYFRLIGCGLMGNDGSCDYGSSEFLYDELPFFQPKPGLYVTDPDEQKGIHCRFGMKGVIAENHFDGSRNVIAVLGGQRRYILSHPDQCDKLALYPKGHPSARHSAVDWSDPDLTKYPQFATAAANEVVLEAGQVLYLPTNWFHFIVSLNLNMQCNTRSGTSTEYKAHMRRCGF